MADAAERITPDDTMNSEPGAPVEVEADASKQKSGGGSSIANKIAAFASGVAPVRKGLANTDEDSITVEEVLHKLEGASRAQGDGNTSLPLPLVRSAYQHLASARDEAAKLAKELAELKSSRVQHIPPSAWVKREHKYKMDQEKYEHTLGMQQQRIERLEMELQLLHDGSNVKPLEEKIQELESQLMAASEEKTKVQSKYHELSIKHRQLIETSPQVATIWNEVLCQQAAAQGDTAAMQRLSNFDLRHTAAGSSLSSAALAGAGSKAAAGAAAGPDRKAAGVSQATAIFKSEGGFLPSGSGSSSGPQTAEERAQALMASVALEGLSPEASIAALQQLNYDLTMQLGLYQQMVDRLKDAMEQSDLEKAELEAEKSVLHGRLRHMGVSPESTGGHSFASSSKRWSGLGNLFSRRERAFPAAASGAGTGAIAVASAGEGEGWADGEGVSTQDASSAGLGSFSSSRRSSYDLDAIGSGGLHHAEVLEAIADSSARDSSLQPEDDEQQRLARDQQAASPSPTPQEAASDSAGGGDSSAAAGGAATGASSSSGGLFATRRARAAVKQAAAVEDLRKEGKELKRQLNSVQEENRFLVQTLVEIKMELAETQGNNDQAKRALVRAMDKETCLELRVQELTHMLDLGGCNQQRAWGSLKGLSMKAVVPAPLAASSSAVLAVATVIPLMVTVLVSAGAAALLRQMGTAVKLRTQLTGVTVALPQ
eukprot:gene6575-6803_t